MTERPPAPRENRDPNGVLAALAEAVAAHPSQRVMQVVGNVFPGDPFYIEDDEAISKLREYAALGRRTVNQTRGAV